MTKEIKCPQCGANCCVCGGGVLKEKGEWDIWMVHCQDCELSLKQLCHTKEKAIATWLSNDRELKEGWK